MLPLGGLLGFGEQLWERALSAGFSALKAVARPNAIVYNIPSPLEMMLRIFALQLVLACGLIVAPTVRADESTVETDLIQAKCQLCHRAIRLYIMEPSRLKEIVDRMTAMNPEWFKSVDSRHLVEVLSTMLKDPKIEAQRKAWEESVSRGKALYSDRSLGTTGKACLDCHAEGSLGLVKDMYPKFNDKLNRFESMEERLSNMFVTKLGGTAPAIGDPRLTDLTLYLRSLR